MSFYSKACNTWNQLIDRWSKANILVGPVCASWRTSSVLQSARLCENYFKLSAFLFVFRQRATKCVGSSGPERKSALEGSGFASRPKNSRKKHCRPLLRDRLKQFGQAHQVENASPIISQSDQAPLDANLHEAP